MSNHANHVELAAEPRTVIGKKLGALRRAGYVPANVYGPGIEPVPIQVAKKEFQDVAARLTRTTMIDLAISGEREPRLVYLQDVQWQFTRREPFHLDFYAVKHDRSVKSSVRLVQQGEAPIARRSDVMIIQPVSQVHIQARPDDMPESLGVDVTGLTEADQAIHLKDVHLPEGVTLLDNPDEVIVKAQLVRGQAPEAAPAPAAAPAEPVPAGEESVS
jgi:large subunit ribosomal protein L25